MLLEWNWAKDPDLFNSFIYLRIVLWCKRLKWAAAVEMILAADNNGVTEAVNEMKVYHHSICSHPSIQGQNN